jgi:isoleucyl-tRNA synthetase
MPFLSEYIYQSLKSLCEKDTKESCFLCVYPSYEYFQNNNLIFTQSLNDIDLIQELIGNIRTLRYESKKHSSLKVPINNLIISNNSTEYLNLVNRFKDIIIEELNILNIEFKELQSNISYIVKPNHKIIGSKFRKDASKVKELITSLNREQIMKLRIIGEINIEGYNIKKDIDVSIEVIPSLLSFGDSYISKIFDTKMLSIDTAYNEEIHKLYEIRKAITIIQKSRRAGGINPWDKILVKIYDVKNKLGYWIDSISYFKDRLKCDFEIVNEKMKEENQNFISKGVIDLENYNVEFSIYFEI